jgi:hypothetical protein
MRALRSENIGVDLFASDKIGGGGRDRQIIPVPAHENLPQLRFTYRGDLPRFNNATTMLN